MKKRSLFAATLLAATALAGCGRSESVDSFKPDRAEEQVAVAETKAAVATKETDAAPVVRGAFAPQDTCAKDESFAAYRAKLDAAIKAKSFDALKPLVDPKIELDFGGGFGHEEFAKRLASGDGGSGPLWPELATVMSLGCSLDKDGKAASAPWYFDNLGERDAFETLIPAKGGVELVKAIPAAGAEPEIIKTLGWDALTITEAPKSANEAWFAVKLDDGTTGFVRRADVRSAVGYRAIFNKADDGNWKMTAFIAGD